MGEATAEHEPGGVEEPDAPGVPVAGDIMERARALGAGGDAVIATDPAGIIVYWNAAAERLYGWAAEEVLGRPVVEVTPSDLSREAAIEIMERLAAGRSWRGEFEVSTKAGASLSVHVSNLPVRSRSGELVGVIGVSRPEGTRARRRR